MNALERKADRLFSAFIRKRDARCMAANHPEQWKDCAGGLQCAHLIRRGFKSVRWDPRNAVALCAYHHGYFTGHPIAWRGWCDELRGEIVMRELLHKAYGSEKVDVAAIVESLEGV